MQIPETFARLFGPGPAPPQQGAARQQTPARLQPDGDAPRAPATAQPQKLTPPAPSAGGPLPPRGSFIDLRV